MGGKKWLEMFNSTPPAPFFAVASPRGGSGKGLNFDYTFPHRNCTISHCGREFTRRSGAASGTRYVICRDSFVQRPQRAVSEAISVTEPTPHPALNAGWWRRLSSQPLSVFLILPYSLCAERRAFYARQKNWTNSRPVSYTLVSLHVLHIAFVFCSPPPFFFCNSDPLMVSEKLCCRPFEHPQVERREFLWVSPDSARRRRECGRLIRYWLFSWDKLIINSWLHPDRNPFRYFEFY